MGTHEKKRDSLLEETAVGVAYLADAKKSPARLQGMQPGGMGEGNKNIPLPLRQFNRAILVEGRSNICPNEQRRLPPTMVYLLPPAARLIAQKLLSKCRVKARMNYVGPLECRERRAANPVGGNMGLKAQ